MAPLDGWFDPVDWLLIGPTMLIALGASLKVKWAFGRWSKAAGSSRMTGAQAAAR